MATATKQKQKPAAGGSITERKVVGRPFQKGQSGNPSGMHKGYLTVVEAARQHTESAIQTLKDLSDAAESEQARVAASTALLDRGWGKPTQPSVDLTPPVPSPLEGVSVEDLRLLLAFLRKAGPGELELLLAQAKQPALPAPATETVADASE